MLVDDDDGYVARSADFSSVCCEMFRLDKIFSLYPGVLCLHTLMQEFPTWGALLHPGRATKRRSVCEDDQLEEYNCLFNCVPV